MYTHTYIYTYMYNVCIIETDTHMYVYIPIYIYIYTNKYIYTYIGLTPPVSTLDVQIATEERKEMKRVIYIGVREDTYKTMSTHIYIQIYIQIHGYTCI